MDSFLLIMLVRKILSDEPITIFQSQSASDMIVPIEWAEDRGILVEVDAAEAYVDESYETTIEWTLTVAP